MNNKRLCFIILFVLTVVQPFDALAQQGRILIGSVDFRGHFPVGKNQLLSNSGIQTGSAYRPEEAAQTARKLEAYLRDQGYLYARIDSIATAFSDDSLRAALIIYGDAGNAVYFGDIEIEADSIRAETYRKYLSLKKYDPYAKNELENNLNILLEVAADSGYLHAEGRIDDFSLKRADQKNLARVHIRIREKERVQIRDIIFRGNDYTRSGVLLRELPVQPGMIYSRERVERIPERLARLGILKNIKEPVIVLNDRRNISLLIDVEEGNATSFDGVVGYIPTEKNSSQDGYFSGLLNLSLTNLFGTGRRFGVLWKKPDRTSEEFSLRYEEPWVFGYPFDLGLKMERVVRDSTYIEWQYEVNSRVRIGESLYAVSRIGRKLALPDSASSRDLSLARNGILNLEVGLEYDVRDYPLNPASGFYYRNTYSYGFKENFGPSYLLGEEGLQSNERIETIKIGFKWFQSAFTNQVMAVELNGYKVSGTDLQLTDYFWFGGSRTLRGYRENQFRGEIVAWANLEYRFLLNRNSRIFAFNDWGFFKNAQRTGKKETTLPGYGFGIRLDTGLGIMGIDYGLGRGDSFGQGKIHFGLINRF